MDAFLAALETSAFAQYLRVSRWGYAAISATHIFGIALLVGAVFPLNLKFVGLWRETDRAALVRVLAPMAASGLLIAVFTGLMLFSVRAQEYANVTLLQAKLVLISLAILSAFSLHRVYGPRLEGAPAIKLAWHGTFSTACWLGALACGRLIAFAGD